MPSGLIFLNLIDLQSLKAQKEPLPKLFMCHGGRDPLVDFAWGKSTFEKLQAVGVDAEFHAYENLFHEINRSELKKLREWIGATIPVDS